MNRPTKMTVLLSEVFLEDCEQDDINYLASHIAENGQISPIHVLSTDKYIGCKYLVLLGKRRVRAMRAIGKETVDCLVHSDLTDEEIAEIRRVL